MASIDNSGAKAPTHRYGAAVIDMFPRANKSYLVESSIASRSQRDYLSTNCSVFNGAVTDNYIEFDINGSEAELIDLSSIAVELKLRITNADGTPIGAAANISLVDGFLHRIFQSHSVFLNNIQVEGSSQFGLLNTLKIYSNANNEKLSSIGRCMLYKSLDTTITSTIVDGYFNGQTPCEESIIAQARGLVHVMGPLLLDISDCDAFLLDKVNLRIRLELALPSLVILSSGNEQYRYSIELCKLWATKLTPASTAMIALNKNLIEKYKTIEYIFDRPILKNVVFPANHSNLVVDNVFNGIIPHKIVVFIIDQAALNGRYNANPAFFTHNNLSRVKLEVNGNVLSNYSCAFPASITQAFYQSVQSMSEHSTGNLFTFENYKNGRTFFSFDTRASDAGDTLQIESTGSVRLSLSCSQPATANKVVFILGYTTGTIEINADRRVFINYLQ